MAEVKGITFKSIGVGWMKLSRPSMSSTCTSTSSEGSRSAKKSAALGMFPRGHRDMQHFVIAETVPMMSRIVRLACVPDTVNPFDWTKAISFS